MLPKLDVHQVARGDHLPGIGHVSKQETNRASIERSDPGENLMKGHAGVQAPIAGFLDGTPELALRQAELQPL